MSNLFIGNWLHLDEGGGGVEGLKEREKKNEGGKKTKLERRFEKFSGLESCRSDVLTSCMSG